jgi:hypothetical protein
MTWNAAGILRGSHELALINLLTASSVDIAIVTEVEIPHSSAPFAITGYTTFYPNKAGHSTRVLMFIKTSVATESNAMLKPEFMDDSGQSIWVSLGHGGGRTPVGDVANARHGNILVGGFYRQWRVGKDHGKAWERVQLDNLVDLIKTAAGSTRASILMGDFNLDVHRSNDASYSRQSFLHDFVDGTEAAGYAYVPTGTTYRSHAKYGSGDVKRAHNSCLDLCFVTGINAIVEVLPDRTTDHRPLLARLRYGGVHNATGVIERRNFKAITVGALESALENACNWDKIYAMSDVDEILTFLMCAIYIALDIVAPMKRITVRKGANLYLAADTIAVLNARDNAKAGAEYRALRNRGNAMVRRDKTRSNMSCLDKCKGDSRTLWSLANAALGKSRPPLPPAISKPDGSMTAGDLDAAKTMGDFFITKVEKLRERNVGCKPPPSNWPEKKGDFDFTFTNGRRIARVIRGLGSTEAIGIDGVPTSVYRKGSDKLAGPISHLVNMSLAAGKVPVALKTGVVHPVFKGQGKNRADPASYRPVSILCAISKVVEVVVKEQLEAYLATTNALPTTQHGFRPKRSCTTALAAAHAEWTEAAKNNVVGVLSFDLSAAFDTLDPSVLLPKMEALGIRGRSLRWFGSYLRGGKQIVCWNGVMCTPQDVEYGVRQGSILGPLLYLVHVADMPNCIMIFDGGRLEKNRNGCYADDSQVMSAAKTTEEVINSLNRKAALFSAWARGNGLALNGGKTQFLLSSSARYSTDAPVSVTVDGKTVYPAPTLELLGVTIDRRFSFRPQEAATAAAARARASMVARLGHQLPKGEYLRRLAMGLAIGKVAAALPAVYYPRLLETDKLSGMAKSTQVAFNDIARTVTGTKRGDHVRVPDLLDAARIPSINRLAVEATAVEAWKALSSNDGGNGNRNPVGMYMLGGLAASGNVGNNNINAPNRTSRSNTAGEIRVQLRGHSTFVNHAARMWNACPALRVSTTLLEAKRAAKALALSAPI